VSGPRKSRPRRLSESEIADLLAPLPSAAELVAERPAPPARAATVSVPTVPPPAWITGASAQPFVRPPGVGEMAPIPEQRPRRLRLVVSDELATSQRTFTFSPDHGGCLVVLGHGASLDPLWGSPDCLGRFSPFVPSMELLRDEQGCRLVVVDSDPARSERVITITESAPPSLLVEHVHPDAREPWVLKTSTEAFELTRVKSLELADV
jgi:hypothetical protein